MPAETEGSEKPSVENTGIVYNEMVRMCNCGSKWPRGLRRRSATARLLRLWVRIPWGHGYFSVVNCVLSDRGLCDWLITLPEESYRLWCVVVCDQEISSRMRRQWPALGCSAIKKCVSSCDLISCPLPELGRSRGTLM